MSAVLDWLLAGDVSIQYQAHRDLLDDDRPDLQARIATEGWGARLLAARNHDGHWGRGYYAPKWTSTHYTLVDLRNLCMAPAPSAVTETITAALTDLIAEDGGLNPAVTIPQSDGCINGMVLDFATWFGIESRLLDTIVDFLLGTRMSDGGFNCEANRQTVRHSSMHTTICVLEGIDGYLNRGYGHRADELAATADAAREFLLVHRLFRSHRTGGVIHPSFVRLHHPSRWHFDVLRGLEHFRAANVADPRLEDALDVVVKRRRVDGRWNASSHPGQVHFDMEDSRPSRWNTLRALRVLRHFGR